MTARHGSPGRMSQVGRSLWRRAMLVALANHRRPRNSALVLRSLALSNQLAHPGNGFFWSTRVSNPPGAVHS